MIAPAAGSIQLRLRGVAVLDHRAMIRVGLPHGMAGRPVAWPAIAFRRVSEIREPDRLVIRPPREAGTEAPSLDRLEAARERSLRSLPESYRLRFDPGLELVVEGRSPGARGATLAGAGRRLADGARVVAAAITRRELPLRVVVELPPRESRRLYLALADVQELLIVMP